jgi:hypothetical protein
MAMVNSCITIELVIYGEIESANRVALENASPDKIFRYPKIVSPWLENNSCILAESMKGTGMEAPKR